MNLIEHDLDLLNECYIYQNSKEELNNYKKNTSGGKVIKNELWTDDNRVRECAEEVAEKGIDYLRNRYPQVYENGMIFTIILNVDVGLYNYDTEDFVYKLFVFDNGEMHLMLVSAASSSLKGEKKEAYQSLIEKMGNLIKKEELPENDKYKKIIETKNNRIKKYCGIMAQLYSYKIEEFLGMKNKLSDPKTEDGQKRQEDINNKIIYVITSFLDREDRTWSIERMIREVKNKFSFLGEDLKEDLIKISIYNHIDIYKQLNKEQEQIEKFEKQKDKVKSKYA